MIACFNFVLIPSSFVSESVDLLFGATSLNHVNVYVVPPWRLRKSQERINLYLPMLSYSGG